MTALALDSISGTTTFFVPRFRITIGGRELHEKGSDFLSVQFKDSVKDLSAFELTLNNWDDAGEGGNPRFKYSDDDTIALGARVVLQMGYADAPALETMMIGEITAFDPQFPSSGAPTITVRGLDRLHRMRNKPKTKTWEGLTDTEIARKIAEQNGLGFAGDDTSPAHPSVPQNNMDDIAFVLERAKRLDFEVFVKNDKMLFRKPREADDAGVLLEWGTSLVSFAPSLTLARQVSKVTVRAWDRSKGELIEKTVDRSKLADITDKGKDAGAVLEQAIGEPKEEIVYRESVSSPEDAERLATSILKRSSYAFVTGTAQTVGLPALRAGTTVELGKLGKKFDGKYYVTESTHKIDNSGYSTSITVRKVYA